MSVRTPVRRAILGVLLVLAASSLAVRIATSSGQASDRWLAPVELSAPGGHARQVDVAIGADGTAVAVWTRLRGDDLVVQAAVRPPGGGWQVPTDLAPSGSDPRVAVDARGAAVVVWERFRRRRYVVQAATRPPGGAWERAVDASSASSRSTFPQVGVDPRGNAVAVWSRRVAGISTVQAARRPSGRGWRRPVDLARDADERRGFGGARQAVGDSGRVVVVWERVGRSGGFGPASVLAATGTVGGRWGAPVALSRPGQRASEARVAVGPRGDAVAVWSSSPPTEQRVSVVQSASRPADGRWSARENLSTRREVANYPRVGIDARGNVTAVWNHSDLTGASRLRGAARAAGGPWQAPVDVSLPGEVAYGGELAVSAPGETFAVWHRSLTYHEDTEQTDVVVRAARGVAGGRWDAPVDISAVGLPEGPELVAADPRGGAIAIWPRAVDRTIRVQAATLPGG